MEVGRVGDGSCWRKREHSAPPAGRRSAVGIARTQKPISKKERLEAPSCLPLVGSVDPRLTRPKKGLDTSRPSHGSSASSARHPGEAEQCTRWRPYGAGRPKTMAQDATNASRQCTRRDLQALFYRCVRLPGDLFQRLSVPGNGSGLHRPTSGRLFGRRPPARSETAQGS